MAAVFALAGKDPFEPHSSYGVQFGGTTNRISAKTIKRLDTAVLEVQLSSHVIVM